jgi:hypothetical protein
MTDRHARALRPDEPSFDEALDMTYTNHASLLRSSLSLAFAGLLAGVLASACDLPDKHLGDDAGNDDGSSGGTAGGSCEPGQTMIDDCNTCSCEDGRWACTQIGCDPTGGSADSGHHACDPQQDPSDGCNDCTCLDGQWLCTAIACDGSTSHGDFDCDPAGDLSNECVTCECLASGEWQCTDPSCSHSVELCDGTEPTDIQFVTDATIDGDVLRVTVEHSGGCGSHEYGSCWDGSFAESDPVQAWLQLDHLNIDDQCEAIVTQPLAIDLGPMRDAWIEAYQQPSGTLILHVADWGSLDYTF